MIMKSVAVALVSLGVALSSVAVSAEEVSKAKKAKTPVAKSTKAKKAKTAPATETAKAAEVTHVAPAYHWVDAVVSKSKKTSCLIGQGAPLSYLGKNNIMKYMGHRNGESPFCDNGTNFSVPKNRIGWYTKAI